jgi:glycosyltransferase involved in cell wall biosynthesis
MLTGVTNRLNLLVDGYALSDGSQNRGIGMYLSTVLTGLTRRPNLDVSLLTRMSAHLPAGVRAVHYTPRLPGRFAGLEHDLRLGRVARLCAKGVFWSPAQNPPKRMDVPWVQTLHDLTPLAFEHALLANDARRWRRLGPRISKATALIVPSQSTATQATTYLEIDPGRIKVVPHGVSERFCVEGPRADFGWPYVLVVAAWGPHKGFQDALRAFEVVVRDGFPHRLVFAGPQDAWMTAQLMELVEKSPVRSHVHIAGFLPDLAAAYRSADALLMPSRAEGFGLPLLEAMACGTAVVSYDNTCLPEVIGNAGVLAADGDHAALGTALASVLGDPARQEALVQAGLRRAELFSWDTSVDEHLALFRSLT